MSALLAAFFFISCRAENTANNFLPSDDASLQVIDNPARLTSPLMLQLSKSELRAIGGLQEDEEDEFNHKNGFLTGVGLSDGGFAVIDWIHVRIFDSVGTQVSIVGSAGSGPGEFMGLTQICRLPGDTLLVFDASRRVSLISPRGRILNESLVPDLSNPGEGCFDDGSFVTQSVSRTASRREGVEYAVRRGFDGSIVDSAGLFPVGSFQGIGQYIRLHLHGRYVYLSDPRKNEVLRFTSDGKLDRILRMADEARPMDARSARRWLGGPVGASGADVASGGSGSTSGVIWPYYRSIKIDRTGRLWVRDFPRNDSAPDLWTIYAQDGALVGTLEIPRGAPVRVTRLQPGAAATVPAPSPEFVDAADDIIVLLERDSDGAARFVWRRFE